MKKILTVFSVLFLLVGCGSKTNNDQTIRIGVTPLPHAEIVEKLREPLKESGFELEITTFDDFSFPNVELSADNLDANYFQHVPYMTDYNQKTKGDLVDVLKIHYEPIGIYAGKKSSWDAVSAGDTVLVPNDPTNLPRALQLLEEMGWIRLEGDKDKATVADIIENVHDIKITEVKSDSIAPLVKDAEYLILNGNYAITSKLTDRVLKVETVPQDKIEKIVNVLVVREGNKDSEKTKALVKAFESDAVKEFISTQYGESVISVLQ